MTVSTLLAAGFLIAIAGVVVWMAWSAITGRPSLRRGSGNPGTPPAYDSMPGGGSFDSGGSSGGDGGGGS